MSNLTTGSAANVIVGPAKLMIAPQGTTLPTLTGDTVTWPAGWVECGYTEDGTQLAYSPTYKSIEVDEEMAAIDEILDKETATISAKLAESTLTNLNYAISASTLAVNTTDDTETLEVGSGTPVECLVGLEGKAPKQLVSGVYVDNYWRVVIGYRAKAKANVQMGFKRGDKTVIPIEFTLLADSTKDAGKRLFKIVDKKLDVA